ncbi:DUF4878 domain-containing protein [Nocardia uniformis]|uniref:DUF4878 domain-containing protein n=1 Tax=Nocardia uniformis TaxID=53432 RepID=A0A849CCA6_9NOCA|nr:DUF4878 domain-containing protein [Nocardia uniformis]
MAIQKVSSPADDKTTAFPVVPRDQATTEKIQTGGRPGPLSKPPSTPRLNAGPRNVGPRGPMPGGQEAGRPAPPQRIPPPPRRPTSAPSPADVQPTMPAQPLKSPRAVAPGGQPGQPRPIAPPQRVPAASEREVPPEETGTGRGKRWWLLVAGAAVLVLVLLAAVVGLVRGGTDNSPEAQVKRAINTYTEALSDGDLDQLRAITCGSQHDFYQNISAEQFAGVYRTSKEQKGIPVIKQIDAVRITDDSAMAQATVYTAADPSKQSQRTFDLQRSEDGWKVCDPPATPS